jgi:stage II sporulation protein E
LQTVATKENVKACESVIFGTNREQKVETNLTFCRPQRPKKTRKLRQTTDVQQVTRAGVVMMRKEKLMGSSQVRAVLLISSGVGLAILLSGVKLPYGLISGGLAFVGVWVVAGLYLSINHSRHRVFLLLLLLTGLGLIFLSWQGGQGLVVPMLRKIGVVGVFVWLLAPRLKQCAAVLGFKDVKILRKQVKLWGPGSVGWGGNTVNHLLWSDGSSRLSSLGDFFQELGRTFQSVPEENRITRHKELLALFQAIADQNCGSCEQYDLCWQERFYQTYRELFILVGWVEMGVTVDKSHLKGYLEQECVKPEALLTTVNLIMKQECTGEYWRQRYLEARQFLAERLNGVGALLLQMAETGVASLDQGVEKADNLSKVLRKAGISGGEVRIIPGGKQDHQRLLVTKKACNGVEECRLVVTPILVKTLGRPLAVVDKACAPRRDGYCSFCLAAEPVYGICAAVVQLPKEGNKVSGDSQGTKLISDHLFLCLLSDGMGVGTTAARISRAAVKLAEGMLTAGFEKKFVLANLNSLLLLATPEEEFATLDILLFDQLSGEVELFKVGSAPTYVKKEREVQVIRSTALPVGIVPQVDPEYYRDYLDEGDLIVLVSDGAATLETKDGDDWILKALKRTEISAAQPLCDYLLELAKIESDGEINDDLTIMVLQIEARGT